MLLLSLLSSMANQSRDAPRRHPEPPAAGDRTNSLERGSQSTSSSKGWRKRETEGVGLGIVPALDKGSGEKCSVVVSATNLNLNLNLHLTTAPMAIGSARGVSGRAGSFPEAGAASQSSCYGEGWRNEIAESPRTSAAPVAEELECCFRVADFLSYCNMCKKSLHGQDVYMYRGEKAFCSTECRYQQMMSDEYQEKRGTGVRNPMSTEISSSPCPGDRLFFTGIVVT